MNGYRRTSSSRRLLSVVRRCAPLAPARSRLLLLCIATVAKSERVRPVLVSLLQLVRRLAPGLISSQYTAAKQQMSKPTPRRALTVLAAESLSRLDFSLIREQRVARSASR